MRDYCKHCQYPVKTCICSSIVRYSIGINIVIVQHPKESSHAKNTAKLVTLCLSSAIIVNAHDADAMEALRKSSDLSTTVLVYPSENSNPIESLCNETTRDITTLILIDGSWKQAFGIIKQNVWLQTLQSVHFTQSPRSDYVIRHTSLAHALSTLEATAYSISCLTNIDTSGIYELQRAMQHHWQGPITHRRQI